MSAPVKDDAIDRAKGKEARPVITLDVALYESYLADSSMTADEKHAYLEALWSIIVSCVSLGFGVHPLQQVEDESSSLVEAFLQSGSANMLELPAPRTSAPAARRT